MPFEIEQDGKKINVYTEEEVQRKVNDEVVALKVTNEKLKDEKDEMKSKIDDAKAEADKAALDKATAEGDLQKVQDLLNKQTQDAKEKTQQLQQSIISEKSSTFLNGLVNEMGLGGQKNNDFKDLISARYDVSYDIESGQTVVKDKSGQIINDLKETLTNGGQYNDYISSGNASGSGANGSNASGDGKTMPREKFDSLDQAGRSKFVADGGKLI